MGENAVEAVAKVSSQSKLEPQRFDEFKMLNEKAIDTANIFLRSALFVNGGAAVAVLGFVASVVQLGEEPAPLLSGIADSLLCFAWGVAAAVTTLALAYLTHYANLARINAKVSGAGERRFHYAKRAVHLMAVAGAIASVVLFVVGAYQVRGAVLTGLANVH